MRFPKYWMMAIFATTSASVVFGQQPAANKPAADIPIPTDETPKQSLLRGCDVEEQLDLNADMQLYDYSTPLETDLVRASCKYYVSLTRMELAVRARFGRKQEGEMMHGIGENTEEDARNAGIKVDGDKANVQFPGDKEPSVFMIHVGRVWKLDPRPVMKSADEQTIRDWIKSYDAKALAVAPLSDKVKQGNYKTIADVISELKRVIDSN